MAIVIPDVGETLLLQFMVGDDTPNANWTLRLYVNDHTPTGATVLGSLTEMTTQGYAAKTLTNTSWSVSDVGVQSRATYAEQTYVFDGTGGATNVYGYYLTDNTSGALLWVERFSGAPIVVPATYGGEIKVTPQIEFATLSDL